MSKISKKKLSVNNQQGNEITRKYSEKHYSFNFSCLTNDSNYNFDSIGKTANFTGKNLKNLSSKLRRLSELSIQQIAQQAKNSGDDFIERRFFTVTSIFDEIDKKFPPSKDTKYLSFRFASQKCRLICKEGEELFEETVLYVVCVDWSMNTYPHGR